MSAVLFVAMTFLLKKLNQMEGIDFYEPLYKAGDILTNAEGHEIKIIDIVADQYKYDNNVKHHRLKKLFGSWICRDVDDLPYYEFCNVIDYWYTTKQKYSDWVKPLNERLKALHS